MYRGQQIDVLKNLRFAELKEWNEIHEAMAAVERKQYEDVKK